MSDLATYRSQGLERCRLWILAIVVAASVLRVLMLTKESLWLDELASWSFSSRDLGFALRSEPTNPPLYYVALHFWIRLFGAGEAALRSLSILPSVATVALLYLLGKRLFSPQTALLACAFTAISSFHIAYAQEARVPALQGFLILAATYELWMALHAGERRSRIAHYGFYALLCAAALYSHFIAVFFLAAHGTYVLLRRRDQLRWAALSVAASLLLFAPWLLTMLQTASRGGQSRRYLLLKFPQTYFSLIFGDTAVPMDERAVQNVGRVLLENWYILAAALFSVAVLLWHLRPIVTQRKEQLLFALNLCVTPVVLAFLVSFRVMLFDERYLLGTSPFLYLVLSVGATEILRRGGSTAGQRLGLMVARAGLAAFLLLLFFSLYNYYWNPRYGKEQWREAVAYLDAREAVGGAAMMVFEPDYLHFCYDYYTKRPLKAVRITPQLAAEVAGNPGILVRRLEGADRVWLVRSHAYGEAVLSALKNDFEERDRRLFPKAKGIELRLLVRKTALNRAAPPPGGAGRRPTADP